MMIAKLSISACWAFKQNVLGNLRTFSEARHFYSDFIIHSCKNIFLKKNGIFYHLAEFFSKICRQPVLGPGNSDWQYKVQIDFSIHT
jgi:hypothetical protein